MELRENCVYALPDGREFIARIGTHGGYFLHDPLRGVAAAAGFNTHLKKPLDPEKLMETIRDLSC